MTPDIVLVMSITAPPHERATPIRMTTNALRGALIGMAELLPGISGGTVALVVGVYERLLQNLSLLGTALRQLVTGPDRRASFGQNLRRIEWAFIAPLLLGMGVMVLTVAGLVESLVSAEPVASRALFFGLVAESLVVPWRLALRAGSGGFSDIIVFVVAAGASFWLVGFAGAGVVTDPPMLLVFAAAAVAVCALVVPGVSGSFFLLAIGLYAPTLKAVADRDLGYLAVFALGALVGLTTIVRALRWLLAHRRRATLLAMTGLMLGSLRALWPWQTSETGDASGVGVLLPPTGEIWMPVLLAVVGAAAVVGLIIADAKMSGREDAPAQERDAVPSVA